MCQHGSSDEPYEPTEDERKEIEEILSQEQEKNEAKEEFQDRLKNRKFYTFNSESHFAGWLKINGIKW